MALGEVPIGGAPYRVADEDVAVSTAQPMTVDPGLVERALRSHPRTQNSLAERLRRLNIEPLSPAAADPDWDIAWRQGSELFVAEVKSLSAKNEERQLRMAVGQVLRYRQAASTMAATVHAVIAAEMKPRDESWTDLCRGLGITLTWPPDWLGVAPTAAGERG